MKSETQIDFHGEWLAEMLCTHWLDGTFLFRKHKRIKQLPTVPRKSVGTQVFPADAVLPSLLTASRCRAGTKTAHKQQSCNPLLAALYFVHSTYVVIGRRLELYLVVGRWLHETDSAQTVTAPGCCSLPVTWSGSSPSLVSSPLLSTLSGLGDSQPSTYCTTYAAHK